jgi:flagellar capping protein FliD
MMSVINSDDVTYKAQFAELSDMKIAVADMQQTGLSLGSITDSLDGATVASRLQDFVRKYNDWINRFEGSVSGGGVLTGTQAAEVSLHELEQSIENPFNGARSGFRGLNDLGISIDENSHLATLNTNKLNAALASNKTGVVDTIREFGANYGKSAELLNSAGNFIPNRLANLDRAIEYIDSNKNALQSEFGTGAPAKTTQQISNALARYQQIMAT